MSQKNRLIFFLSVVLTISGCSSEGVPLGTVSGHVTKAGAPQQGVSVLFEPVDGGRGSEGLTDASGYYQLAFAGRKGAVLGKHNVKVEIKAHFNEGGIMTKPAQEFLTAQREVQSDPNVFDFEISGEQKSK